MDVVLRALMALFVLMLSVELFCDGLKFGSLLRFMVGIMMGLMAMAFAMAVVVAQRPYPPADVFDWVWMLGGAFTVLSIYRTRHDPSFPASLGWRYALSVPAVLSLAGGLNILRTALG